MSLFQRKPKTIEEKLRRDGAVGTDAQRELAFVAGEFEPKGADVQAVITAIFLYFDQDPMALSAFDHYFAHHDALSVIPLVEQQLMQYDIVTRPILGLALYLLRFATQEETVKFALSLLQYTDFNEKDPAMKLVYQMATRPAFALYALMSALKSQGGTGAFYQVGQHTTVEGREIYTLMAQNIIKGERQWNWDGYKKAP
ncbi:MAG: hypothetical protein Q4E76_07190 [Tissierellia bacterium]|nr:hypothetical protein [Tissierellia bacterium]